MQKVSAVVGLVLVALSGSALAQDEAPAAVPAVDAATARAGDGVAALAPGPEGAPVPASPVGTTYISRGLTVGAGALQVTLPVVLDLSKDEMLKPVWIPLELRFGVIDELDAFLATTTSASRLPSASAVSASVARTETA
jgi:hypothetical protein